MTLLQKVITENDSFLGCLEDNSQVNLTNRELYSIVIHFPYRLPPKNNQKTKEIILRKAYDKAQTDKQYFYFIPGDWHVSIDHHFESAVAVVPCYRFEAKGQKN